MLCFIGRTVEKTIYLFILLNYSIFLSSPLRRLCMETQDIFPNGAPGEVTSCWQQVFKAT